MMDANKQKALSAALSQIEKQFGKGSVMRSRRSAGIRGYSVHFHGFSRA
jgi:recombination protein RecA